MNVANWYQIFHKWNCKVNITNRVLRNELLDVVIKAEVYHVKHSIASHCRCYTLVQSTQTKAIFLYDLSRFGDSRSLLSTGTPQTMTANN